MFLHEAIFFYLQNIHCFYSETSSFILKNARSFQPNTVPHLQRTAVCKMQHVVLACRRRKGDDCLGKKYKVSRREITSRVPTSLQFRAIKQSTVRPVQQMYVHRRGETGKNNFPAQRAPRLSHRGKNKERRV